MDSRTIIYPTDFSACAENAMQYVIPIAKAMKCKVQIVHSIDASNMLKSEENPLRVIEEIQILDVNAKTHLKKIKIKMEANGIACITEMLKYPGISWLPEYIKEHRPYLVVMGTVGSGDLGNKVFGSNAYRVITKTDFPLMVVPKDATYRGFEKMIFATDFEKKDTENINFLIKIARHYKAAIDVVNVTETVFEREEEKFYANNLKDELSKTVRYGKMDYKFLFWDNVEERLEILLKESNADLLALVNRKKNFIDCLFHKSIVKKMMYRTHIPLLIFS
ncbi:universal stress protein [Eudoraea sp.]|uniref:universal stress protein n=1 Tax=Eudoraea sp. TaxID=1979955 RepID=UPI003C77E26E